MTQFDIVISAASFSSLIGLVVGAVKLYKELKSGRETADSTRLQILEEVGKVKDKISEQNGDLKVVKTMVANFDRVCNMHITGQNEINNRLSKRIENLELLEFGKKGGG